MAASLSRRCYHFGSGSLPTNIDDKAILVIKLNANESTRGAPFLAERKTYEGKHAMKKRRKIIEGLEAMEKCLADAEKYVAQNVNVEGASWLHTVDWKGKSGHPLWMKNFMIPTTKKALARREKALDRINNKTSEKLKQRRQRGKRS
jgi:hypothetical protein